jgi:hypothetical protein
VPIESAANDAESARSDPCFVFFIGFSFALFVEVTGKLPLMKRFDQNLRHFRIFCVVAVSLLQRSMISSATTNSCGLLHKALFAESLHRYRGRDG